MLSFCPSLWYNGPVNSRVGYSLGATLSGAAAILCLVAAIAVGGWSAFWLGIGAVGFGVEAYALATPGNQDTLSYTIWQRTRPLWLRIPLAIFMVWLTLHFIFGG